MQNERLHFYSSPYYVSDFSGFSVFISEKNVNVFVSISYLQKFSAPNDLKPQSAVIQTSRQSTSVPQLRSQQTTAPPWNITKQHPGIYRLLQV